MSSLFDFLHSEESRLGAAEAGRLRNFLLMLLFLWSLTSRAPAVLLILPPVLMVLDIVLERYLKKRGRSADPGAAVVLQLFLVALWSILLPGDLPLAGVYLLVLYGSSLYLRVNLVLFTAASGIVLMNLGYLYGLAVSGGLPVREALGGLPANPFNWPGFQAQIFSTLILLFFAYVFPGRQRIIRRLIGRQQAYFEMVRDQNSPLSDSLELFARNFGLSSREEEVLAVLILGKTYRMIAGELFISLDTVKSHVKNIYRKCGVGSREELLEVLRQSILVSSQGREDLK